MATPRRAYYFEGKRLTPSQFKRLSRERKIAVMTEWFGARFEDPAERISYQTREGGYLWAGAGPHDADDELQGEFGDLASLEDIQAAVEEVQSEGTFEWASSRYFDEPDEDEEDDGFDEDGNRSINLPFPDLAFDLPPYDARVAAGEVADGDDERPPLAGVSAEERDLRSTVIAALDQFDAASVVLMADRARRGHNHPPAMIEDGEELPWAELDAARNAAAELREETAKEEPDQDRVASVAQRIGSLARTLGRWLANNAAAGIVGNAATAGAVTIYHNPNALHAAANTLATAASEWAQHLASFW